MLDSTCGTQLLPDRIACGCVRAPLQAIPGPSPTAPENERGQIVANLGARQVLQGVEHVLGPTS